MDALLVYGGLFVVVVLGAAILVGKVLFWISASRLFDIWLSGEWRSDD